MPRSFHLPAAARARPLGRDVSFHARHAVGALHITPQHHLAPVAVVCGVGLDVDACRHGDGGGLRQAAAALPVAAHQHRAATGRARCVELGAGIEPDVLAQHLHLAAAFVGVGAAGVHAACHAGGACCAAIDDDLPLARAQAAGTHHPFQVQHRVGKAGTRGSAGLHAAAGRGTGIAQHVQACVQAAVVADVEEHQTIALHIDADVGGCSQTDALGLDVGLRADRELRCRQHHGAVGGRDGAIGDQRCSTVGAALQHKTPRLESIAHHEGAGHKPSHIHLRVGTKHDAAGVEQPDAAVGAQAAQDERRVTAHHAVDQDRIGTGLLHQHALAAGNRETLPVQPGARAGLRNGHLAGGGGLHLGLAKCQLRASGQIGQSPEMWITREQGGGQSHRSEPGCERSVVVSGPCAKAPGGWHSLGQTGFHGSCSSGVRLGQAHQRK